MGIQPFCGLCMEAVNFLNAFAGRVIIPENIMYMQRSVQYHAHWQDQCFHIFCYVCSQLVVSSCNHQCLPYFPHISHYVSTLFANIESIIYMTVSCVTLLLVIRHFTFRMCAVFGGIYCLRRTGTHLILDSDNKYVAVTQG